MTDFQPIRSLGAREASTVAGNAASRVLSSPTARAGVMIHNASVAHSLWIRIVEQGASAPTITSSDRDYVIPPENTLTLDVSETLDLYAQNSSGAATTSAYTATEVKR